MRKNTFNFNIEGNILHYTRTGKRGYEYSSIMIKPEQLILIELSKENDEDTEYYKVAIESTIWDSYYTHYFNFDDDEEQAKKCHQMLLEYRAKVCS